MIICSSSVQRRISPKLIRGFVSALCESVALLQATGVLLCCAWCSVAMAQMGDGGSAPQVRVRIFLEAPLGTAAAAPLAVRVQHVGSVLQLRSGGAEATTRVQVVIYATDTAAELRMTLSVDAVGAEVVEVPSESIVVAAVGNATRRSAEFALTAKKAGAATVTITVTDSINNVTVALRVVVGESMPQHTLAVIEPQPNTELQLVSRGAEATTQVPVVIDATDSAAELRMTISVDAAGAEVVTVPNVPIIIAAAGNATQRSAEFELTAKTTGTATVTIAVTDGARTDTVALRVVVRDPVPMPQHTLAVIEPLPNTELQLVSRGVEATTQVPVVIDATDSAAELRMTLSVDAAGAEVVAIPNTSIVIAAAGNATRRSAEFELTAKKAGMAVVTIAVTDGASTDTVALRVVVMEGPHTLAVIEPQADTELRLLSRGAEVTTQVPVVIDTTDSAAELRMTLLVDSAGAEVVTIPSEPIVIAAVGDATRRSAEFELTAKTTGTATVTIVVTDGASTDTVALRVVVADPPSLQILSPLDGTQIALVRGDGSLAATQVEVVIVQQHTEVPVALDLQLERIAMPSVFISTTSLSLTASADGSTRTRFTLAAAEAGNTTLTLVASNSLGNRAVVSVRVSVTRVKEPCESCLVPDMITVSTGTFTMGSPATEAGRLADEGPQHQVRIGYAFAAGRYELTRGQYRAFVDASGYEAGINWLEPAAFTQTDAHPVVFVSWDDAKVYLSWLSEQTGEEWRLLSEAEWEYAARAGTTTSYFFGNTIDATQARFDANGTVAVGSYAANAFGLYDMHGNVSEWVEDCYHNNYNEAPVDGSVWLSECDDDNRRVVRGGSWAIFPDPDLSRFLRSAQRNNLEMGNRINGTVGFRVARTLSP